MIKIRLSRGGAKNNPFYRIVATEKTRKRSGKPLEVIGYWHPIKNDLKIDREKLKKWVDKGAQVNESVKNLIKK